MKKAIMAVMLFSLTALCAFGQEDGFVSIFNGKDLTGWSGNMKYWSVEDGAIVGKTPDPKDPDKLVYNQSLAWKEEVGDFIIKFDFWIAKGGNSGLYYRGWYLNKAKPFQMGGYQGDFDGNASYTGIVYGEALRGIIGPRGAESIIPNDSTHKSVVQKQFAKNEDLKKIVKIEDWNSYEIIAQGHTFTHKVNGQVMSVLVDEDQGVRRDKGLLAWQLHVGPSMTVKIKNIMLKKIK